MSDQPHRQEGAAGSGEAPTDAEIMLNDILDRAAGKSGEPAVPESDVSRETLEAEEGSAEPEREEKTPKKNKPSSVYVYLAVLFGAAFLMLLLAYFVQQRNNATAMDDLRMTTNASREELLEQIKTLEEEQKTLEVQLAELEKKLEQEKEYSQEFQILYDGARSSASHIEYCLHKRSEAMELLWQLDRAYAQRDHALCRQLVEWMETPKNNPLKNFLPTDDDRSQYDHSQDGPTPAERYQEIYNSINQSINLF